MISSDCGGVRSLFTGKKEGLFYETADTEALVNCLRRVFREETLVARLHENGRRRAGELHDAEKNYRTLLAIYEKIAGKTE